jgi:hypothetical protein
MSEKPYWEERPAVMLRTWVLGQMLRGAGYAAVVVFGIGLVLYAIYLLGLLLPADSKTAPDPSLGALPVPAIVAAA